MNALVSAAILSRRDVEIIEQRDGSATFAVSPQFACHYDRADEVLWSRWMPHGIPSFNAALLGDLVQASAMIESYFKDRRDRPLRHVVLRSGVPAAFNLGGDLGLFHSAIVGRNRSILEHYAYEAVRVVFRNYRAYELPGVTTVALLEADALGGGFECALSCDVIIAERHVKAGFPEVLFNMFPGMGGISLLARRVGRKTADDLVRTGRQYTALELLELGVIDAVVDTGEGEAAVHKLMRKREFQHAAHCAMNRVDRLVRPITEQELLDVVQIWVDCALDLDLRSLEWMQRLYQRQLGIFGGGDRQAIGGAKVHDRVQIAA